MKFTRKQLGEILEHVKHGVLEPTGSVQRFEALLRSEIEDTASDEPDTIEMYFANGYKIGQGNINPFEHRIDYKGKAKDLL